MLILFLKRLILNHCREASYMKPAFFPLSCVLSSFGFCLVSFVFFFWAMLISFVSDPVCLWLFITVGRWSVLFQILYACGCSSRSVAGQFCFISCIFVDVHLGRSLPSYAPRRWLNVTDF